MEVRMNELSTFGVEIEYMIVAEDSLDVKALADELIPAEDGVRKNDVLKGAFRWSNELVLHVIEIKTAQPVGGFSGLAEGFHGQVADIEKALRSHGARLLPGGVHPWMNPDLDTRLWPHGDREIYEAFDRIFNCRGHGWSNLQSTHLNVGFGDAEGFRRLHSAIRLILPLLPALAAASPFCDGQDTACLDARLLHYAGNCARFPSITGQVVPERILSPEDYEETILQRIYNEMSGADPEGILREEWVNARGAIARFERNAVEIRVLDAQECPRQDLAILSFTVALLRYLLQSGEVSLEQIERPGTSALGRLFRSVIAAGKQAPVSGMEYAAAFGLESPERYSVEDLLVALIDRLGGSHADWYGAIRLILDKGNLAERLRAAAGPEPSRGRLHEVWSELADCLRRNEPFRA